MTTLPEIDRQLLACDFDQTNLTEIEVLLARRNELVGELAGQLRGSLEAGAELTRKLANYRGSLTADLRLHQYVADDITGDSG